MSYYQNQPSHSTRIEGGSRRSIPSSSEGCVSAPLITIITAVRNGEKTLECTIKSIIDQSYDRIEYIIIDGGSTDGTLDIIRKFADRVDYWVSEPDKGIYDAMNKGIRAATGDLINLLNADDYLEPGALQLVSERFMTCRIPSIIYGNAYYMDEAYGLKALFHSTLSYWLGMTVNHQSMFVHKDIYEAIGLYDTRFQLGGDYDFFARSMRHNIPFIRIDSALVNCRNTGATFSRSAQSKREVNAINRSYFGTLSLKRTAFLIFNRIWMPMKLWTRSFLYRTIGTTCTRKAIDQYKRMKKALI